MTIGEIMAADERHGLEHGMFYAVYHHTGPLRASGLPGRRSGEEA